MNNQQKNLKPLAKDNDFGVLNTIVDKIAREILAEFADKQLKENELALSLIDLTKLCNKDKESGDLKRPDEHLSIDELPEPVNFRGEEPIYPASVVKLFYLAAAQQWLEDKKILESDEIVRACKDMIVDSSNDATHYIVDVLTDTTGGPELPPDEMATWMEKRNAINRYFQKLGYKHINVNQKTWGDGPFGRERIAYGKDLANRNKLTTNATARLLSEIVTGKCVSKERSKAMLDLLARDFCKPSHDKACSQNNSAHNQAADPDDQSTGFMGSALPPGARLWSKAGWMSTARHDAVYVELPDGIRFVLVAFISGHAKEYAILPSIAEKVIKALRKYHNSIV